MSTGQPSQFKQAMDSTVWKLMQPIMLALLCYFSSQIMSRLDRLEQKNESTQIMLATSNRDVQDLKSARTISDADLQNIHSQQADMMARVAVLEARMRNDPRR